MAAGLAKGPPPGGYGQSVTLMAEGFCNWCRRPLGLISWDADFVLCRRCKKADDVYTPPGR